MKLNSASDIAELLRVELEGPNEQCCAEKKENLDIKIKVKLADEYIRDGDEILEAVNAHAKDWSTQMDIFVNPQEKKTMSSDFSDDCYYSYLWYAQHPEIFSGTPYTIAPQLKKPSEPKTLNLLARIRIGGNLYLAPFEGPYTVTKTIEVVNKV